MNKKKSFSLYVHIPFCSYKCPYCDFNTYALKKIPEKDYLKALLGELELSLSNSIWKNRIVETVYFGGGTPSIFSANSIEKILKKIPLKKNAEITLEANPKEISLSKLKKLRSIGVNRISLGSQSLNNKTLKSLGRKHTRKDTLQTLKNAKIAGFENINLDLIFAVPNQTFEELEMDLNEYSHLDIQHISTYELTIEKGTPFYLSYKNKLLKKPKETQTIKMYRYIRRFLGKKKFKQYEISNFAKNNFYSRHNSNYWNHTDYLGIGAGSSSFYMKDNGAVRLKNLSLPNIYIKNLLEKKLPLAWQEKLNKNDLIFEHIFLGLRKSKGFNYKKIEHLLNERDKAKINIIIKNLELENLLKKKDSYVALTPRGQELVDSITEQFIL